MSGVTIVPAEAADDMRTGGEQWNKGEYGGDGREVRFVAVSAAPLLEPIVAKGPFVMSSDAQIAEAFAEYRQGKWGSVPEDSDEEDDVPAP